MGGHQEGDTVTGTPDRIMNSAFIVFMTALYLSCFHVMVCKTVLIFSIFKKRQLHKLFFLMVVARMLFKT